MKKLFTLALLAIAGMATAQIDVPAPSPLGTSTQTIGLTQASVTYSRPSAKDRVIFGDLVPYDEMWRTGANKSTKLTFSDTVKINNVKVAPGSYSLFTVPGKLEWMIIISKQVDLSGTTGYDMAQDVTRFKVKPSVVSATETFTINFSDVTPKSANIELVWETTSVKFAVESDPEARVMANIESVLTVSGAEYYSAARYYFDNGKDLNQALTWINEAVKTYEKFWVLRVKAQIQAGLGDYKGAIETANKSTTLAKEAKNNEYVKMNDESIAEWTKKL